jgi:hypothetical protein
MNQAETVKRQALLSLTFGLLAACSTTPPEQPPEAGPVDAAVLSADAGERMADAGFDNCPPLEQRPEPLITHHFEDQSPEISRTSEQYTVIAPQGHEALAEHALAALPACHQAIQELMGYCHPWRRAIVHFGRFETSKAKASDGVVAIGRPERSLDNLDLAASWPGPPAFCAGQSTLAHESAHTFQPASLPAWLKEGWADYVGQILVKGMTYRCEESSFCVLLPPSNGRPQPDECPTPVEYWDLSDPNWSSTRPEPGADAGPNTGAENKSRYYKTGTCFWQSLHQAFGGDALRQVMQKMHAEPRDDLPVFPFSAATNELLIRSYFEPVMGQQVWPIIERYGIERRPAP